jgi:PEP-CTERM motif
MNKYLLATLLAIAGSQAQAASLTGMVLFQVDSSGATSGVLQWNTTGGDEVYNVYLQSGGVWLNSDNAGTTSPNFALGPGTTTLQYYAFPVDLGDWAGINLFFDNQGTPSITVLLNPGAGTFGPNLVDETRGLVNGFPVSNTAKSVTFTASGQTITLTGASLDYSGGNTVQPFANSPSYFGADIAGTLTFDATTSGDVPEPGSWSLLLAGIGAIGLLFRRHKA